jgi:putative spermidine/putrescine transport system substrate-binding protein
MTGASNSKGNGSGLRRRSFLKLAASTTASIAAPALLTRKVKAAPIQIVATDVGGAYTKAYTEAYYKPFNELMRGEIEVVNVTIGSAPTAECEQMVRSKNYTWDLVDIASFVALTLQEKGLLEDLRLENDPDVQQIPAQFRTPYLIGLDAYATVLGYRSDAFSAGREPVNGWRDVWDVKGVPGRRALRKWPFDTIEEALMADGVGLKDLYPCDFDRAYGSLNRIKPDVAAWWTTGAQTTQMLTSREVDMVACWNTRAQAIIDAGGPVKISWNQGILNWGGWVVLMGNPKLDACRKLIKFACQAKQQAIGAQFAAYGPCNPDAYKYIDSTRARSLPTHPEYLERMTVVDDKFWGPRKESELVRFNNWLLS